LGGGRVPHHHKLFILVNEIFVNDKFVSDV